MPNFYFKKHVLPHLLALVVFLFLVVVFYHPIFLENKKIFQNDLLQWEAGAKELIDYGRETGEVGLWTNSMFGGMPADLVTLKYSGDFGYYIQTLLSVGLPHPANQTLVAMISYYVLLLAFRIHPILAVAGAIGFGFNSFNIVNIEAGHNTKGWAIAYCSLVLAGIHMSFTSRRIAGFILTALGMALQTRVNHLQITYYLLLMVLIYGAIQLYLAFREKQLQEFWKTVGILVVAVTISVGSSSGRMIGVYEYSKYSTRGKSELVGDTIGQSASTGGLSRDYVFSWSNGWGETLTLLVPNLYGGPSIQSLDRKSEFANALRRNNVGEAQIRNFTQKVATYWGPLPFTAGPIYIGAVIFFACILALFLIDHKYRYWIGITCVVSMLLAIGKNFPLLNYALYDYLPGYNKFRSVTMAITMLTIAAPLLGMLGVQKLMELKQLPVKKFLAAASWTIGVLLLIMGYSYMGDFSGPNDEQLGYPDWLLQALILDRAALMRGDAIRSLLFILATGGLLLAFSRNRINPRVAMVAFGLLVLLDLWLVAKRLLEPENYQRDPKKEVFTFTDADQVIKQDPNLSYRVANLQSPWSEAFTSYHHKSIGGYHGAKMGRYQDLIERHLQPELETMIGRLNAGNMDLDGFPVVNMLNTRYIKAGSERNSVLSNRNALGNAWFVEDVAQVQGADQEIQFLESFDPGRTAVIDKSRFDFPEIDKLSKGTIKLTDYKPDRLKYEYESTGRGFVVFSEIFYPEGWTATIDGNESEHYRVNYILRGMLVPSGSHVIEFTFAPKAYALGNAINIIFSIIFLAGVCGAVLMLIREQRV